MLDVFFTVDVEIWCDGWCDIDAKFPAAFKKYIFGPTSQGNLGLPYQIQVLNDNGLHGVFFVEPLFSLRFGSQPLAEIVGLIRENDQEVQLHLHTEWVDEARQPLLDAVRAKRQHLKCFSLMEQEALIREGARLLRAAGADTSAFRAGSFGFNRDTLRALAANAILFDSSYNATQFGRDSGVMPTASLVEPILCEGVFEYPMTVFKDGINSLRHVQLTACSYAELEQMLWQSVEAERTAFVILSHNFELLNREKNRADKVVVDRFHRLCRFLARNRDVFHVCGFHGLETPRLPERQPEPLKVSFWPTGMRIAEQVYRRRFK